MGDFDAVTAAEMHVADLEGLVVTRLAAASGRAAWQEFLALDDLLTAIGLDAGQRLAFQAAYPVAR
jgi:hypothetical protein